jgi:hypothetical protein
MRIAKALLTGAAVLGAFFLVVWLGLGLLLWFSMGQGEAGSPTASPSATTDH